MTLNFFLRESKSKQTFLIILKIKVNRQISQYVEWMTQAMPFYLPHLETKPKKKLIRKHFLFQHILIYFFILFNYFFYYFFQFLILSKLDKPQVSSLFSQAAAVLFVHQTVNTCMRNYIKPICIRTIINIYTF